MCKSTKISTKILQHGLWVLVMWSRRSHGSPQGCTAPQFGKQGYRATFLVINTHKKKHCFLMWSHLLKFFKRNLPLSYRNTFWFDILCFGFNILYCIKESKNACKMPMDSICEFTRMFIWNLQNYCFVFRVTM